MANGKRVNDFRPASRNANKHTARGMGALQKSIQADGWIGAMTTAADGEMIAGSARIETVAQVFGTDAEPIIVETDGTRPVLVVRTDIPNADDKRAQRLALADNRVHEIDMSWDVEVLAGFDADVLGELWTPEELSDLGQQWADEQRGKQEDAGAQVDKAEELRVKWGVELGQLWQLGEHRLICGDSTQNDWRGDCRTLIFDPEWNAMPEALTGFADILAFADGGSLGLVISRYGPPTWVFAWDCVSSWYTPNRPLRRMKLAAWYGDLSKYQFDGWHYGDAGEPRAVWNSRGEYRFKPDPRGKHLSDVFQEPITKLHADADHNHSKPIDWVTLLIGNCTTGDVYDPFCGSGTSIVACEQLGRRCVGAEIEPSYVAVAIERWAQTTGKVPILANGA